VVKDILDGLNQHEGDPFHFLPRSWGMMQRALCELDQMGDHVSVHKAGVGKKNAHAGGGRCGVDRRITPQAFAKRGQQRDVIVTCHWQRKIDEQLIMLVE
jgi:predicted flavoprotein YhiN